MRPLFWASLGLGICSLCLAGLVFIQIPIMKVHTTSAVNAINTHYVDRSSLDENDLRGLEHLSNSILRNDRLLLRQHHTMWLAGTIGFLALSVFLFVNAFVISITSGLSRTRPADRASGECV